VSVVESCPIVCVIRGPLSDVLTGVSISPALPTLACSCCRRRGRARIVCTWSWGLPLLRGGGDVVDDLSVEGPNCRPSAREKSVMRMGAASVAPSGNFAFRFGDGVFGCLGVVVVVGEWMEVGQLVEYYVRSAVLVVASGETSHTSTSRTRSSSPGSSS
jgi:hypothetical protein